jgi:hypothetical protein
MIIMLNQIQQLAEIRFTAEWAFRPLNPMNSFALLMTSGNFEEYPTVYKA